MQAKRNQMRKNLEHKIRKKRVTFVRFPWHNTKCQKKKKERTLRQISHEII